MIINNQYWQLRIVPYLSSILRNPDGNYTLGVTIPEWKMIFIADVKDKVLFKRILAHELSHAEFASRGFNVPIVVEEILADIISDNIGVFSNIFITNLVQITITTSNIKEYCDIGREKFFLRYFITKFQDVIEKSRSQSAESTTIIDLAEQLITDIRNDRQNNGFQTIQAVMDESYDRLIKLSGEDRDEYIGIPTGFKDLDHYLGGLNKSDLIIFL